MEVLLQVRAAVSVQRVSLHQGHNGSIEETASAIRCSVMVG
jgi:hypothetical protein